MEFVFASFNPGKIKEIQDIFPQEYKIKGLKDVGITEDIVESGMTFEENAYIKAHFVYTKTNKNTFADDSGLLVKSLNNEPGIYSARYAGVSKNDKQNIELLLNKMKNITDRTAKFTCIICAIINGQKYFFEGELKGSIALQAKGTNGFGYDSVFIPDGYNITLAEMSADEKNKISHRRRAIQKMLNFLSLK